LGQFGEIVVEPARCALGGEELVQGFVDGLTVLHGNRSYQGRVPFASDGARSGANEGRARHFCR
jgi:hypothetical protein